MCVASMLKKCIFTVVEIGSTEFRLLGMIAKMKVFLSLNPIGNLKRN